MNFLLLLVWLLIQSYELTLVLSQDFDEVCQESDKVMVEIKMLPSTSSMASNIPQKSKNLSRSYWSSIHLQVDRERHLPFVDILPHRVEYNEHVSHFYCLDYYHRYAVRIDNSKNETSLFNLKICDEKIIQSHDPFTSFEILRSVQLPKSTKPECHFFVKNTRHADHHQKFQPYFTARTVIANYEISNNLIPNTTTLFSTIIAKAQGVSEKAIEFVSQASLNHNSTVITTTTYLPYTGRIRNVESLYQTIQDNTKKSIQNGHFSKYFHESGYPSLADVSVEFCDLPKHIHWL